MHDLCLVDITALFLERTLPVDEKRYSNGYRIGGNIDREKFVVNLGCQFGPINRSVRSSSRRVGDGVNGVDYGYRCFSQLRVSLY